MPVNNKLPLEEHHDPATRRSDDQLRAITDTGTLVLEGGPGKGRTVTLLPRTYVAVVPVSRILLTVPEAIEKYADSEAGRLATNVCFHTGPSRSGDIEMLLFVGMHGPGDVHVIMVG